MRLDGLAQLAVQDMRATPARSVIAAAGIALGVMVLLLIAGLGLGARDTVLEEVVRKLPVDMVEVVPKSIDLGLFQASNPFGTARLTATNLEAMRTFPEVVAVYPKLEVRLPMMARGGEGLFGRRIHFDLFMVGVPVELIGTPEFRDRKDFIPVVMSDQLLEVFNTSVAPSLGIPKLTPETVKLLGGEVVIGQSIMLGTRGAREQGVELGRVVGVSPFAMRLGATVPIETARRLRAQYGDPALEETFASILLRAGSPADVPKIRAQVEALGLAVDRTAERTSDLLTAATALGSLVGLLVLALAALNIAHSFFAQLSERRRELAIMRAVGARRGDLVIIVLAQAGLLGFFGGAFGVFFAHLFSFAIDAAAFAFLPQFPFRPDSFFSFPLLLDAAAFVAALLAAVLGATWPALAAARAPVVRALADS
jgi:putative ABC transport system permease protein